MSLGLGTPGSLTIVCEIDLTVVCGGGHSRQSLEVVSAGEERPGVIVDFTI